LSYKAALTKNFLRELKKLPENVRKRVLTAIDELIRNPFLGVRLRGELKGKWRRELASTESYTELIRPRSLSFSWMWV